MKRILPFLTKLLRSVVRDRDIGCSQPYNTPLVGINILLLERFLMFLFIRY
jgi:hypothetical protein